MRRIQLQFEQERYPVWIGHDCLEETVRLIADLGASNYHIVTDRTVHDLHARDLHAALARRADVHSWIVEGTEAGKTLATVERLAQRMMAERADRQSIVIAMGGGVVGNVAGLLAALLFRGIRLVHVPTTLIAMGDSVASLKQAVNLPQGKNLLGCFHTPSAVLADVSYLSTLPAVQIRSGMCEIVKNALIVAGPSLEVIEGRLRANARYDRATLAAIVEAGIDAKQSIMLHDRRERGAAVIFEYGHTVGHAIELASEGGITHGEAVGLGMLVAAEVAYELGHLSGKVRDLHHSLLSGIGLEVAPPPGIGVDAVMSLVRSDNKRGYIDARPDEIPMILLRGLGQPIVRDGKMLVGVDIGLVRETLEHHIFGRGALQERPMALCR